MYVSSSAKYAVKGSVLRAYLAALASSPHDAATRETLRALDPAAADLISDPPLPGTWVDAVALARLIEAIHRCGGEAAVLSISREALAQQSMRSLITMVKGILKVFATSPTFLLGHFNELIRTTSRGIIMEWAPLSDHAGRMKVTHNTDVPLPAPCFLTTIPAIETMVGMCGVQARIKGPEMLGRNVSRYLVEW